MDIQIQEGQQITSRINWKKPKNETHYNQTKNSKNENPERSKRKVTLQLQLMLFKILRGFFSGNLEGQKVVGYYIPSAERKKTITT